MHSFYPTETKILCLLKRSVRACRLMKNMNPFLCLLLNRLYYDNVKYFVMYSSINETDFISHDSNKLFLKIKDDELLIQTIKKNKDFFV